MCSSKEPADGNVNRVVSEWAEYNQSYITYLHPASIVPDVHMLFYKCLLNIFAKLT